MLNLVGKGFSHHFIKPFVNPLKPSINLLESLLNLLKPSLILLSFFLKISLQNTNG